MQDSQIVSGAGGILLNMAKPVRRSEPGHVRDEFERLNIPVLGALEGDAYLDGGDHFWLDDTTALVGLGVVVFASHVKAGGDKIVFPEGFDKGVLYTTVDRADNKQYREP